MADPSYKTGELIWVTCSRTAQDQKRLGIILESSLSNDTYIWTVLIGGYHETHHEIYIHKVKDNG
jgi:hypothetical protein